MDTENIVCLNGEYLPENDCRISIGDGGVLYGAGIFETVKVSGGTPRLLERHLSRLVSSAAELGLGLPFAPDKIEEMAILTAGKNNMSAGGLRITLTAGEAGSGPCLFVQTRPQVYEGDKYLMGMGAVFTPYRRNEGSPLVRHKTLNYFDNIIARRQAAALGWDEALFLNNAGCLAEGAVSNIFLVNRGKVITPSAACGLLPGITRRRVIEICYKLSLSLEEREVLPGELAAADEAFLTNALMGVMPLTRLEGAYIGGGGPGEITRLIRAEIEKYC
ncbi:MAG: aminotransferase class IV [Desulfocucumaceae bacterium]